VRIRKSGAEDFPAIRRFYEGSLPGYGVSASDTYFIAEDCGQIRGVVRLTLENGVRVLRGMQVAPGYQKTGIGTALLHHVDSEIGGFECYCIPYAHLERFYGKIEFVRIDEESAPHFLRERLKSYLETSDSVILHRPPRRPVVA
jgi:N-acetylglutamate synthase-like GNAT family acetyltransferase